jgi:polyisoprenoid-binding protein YceI
MRNRWLRWLVGVPIGVVVAVTAGTWLYLNVIRDPPPGRLTLDAAADDQRDETTSTTAPDGPTTSTAAGGARGVDGPWKAATGSQAGYRVSEILNGQRAEAVGRTSAVEGTLTIEGTRATKATFTVDLATVASDESRRDNQFRGRIMDVANHPDATFALAEPIDFGTIPDVGGRLTASATGDLTLRGTTQSVTFPLEAERTAAGFTVAGSIPITFSDYGIPNPSAGPAQVGDEGELELLVVFAR